jgi:hypothetical protein
MSRRKRDDNIAIYVGRCTRRHDQTATRRARKGRKRALNLPGVAHVDRGHLYPERRRHSLDGSQLGVPGGARRIPKNRHPHHTRRDLLEQLQPFPTHAVFELMKPVALPPGFPKLSTKALATGSLVTGKTIGIVCVACSNCPTVEAPWERITSGVSATNSAACLRMASALAVAQRVSIRTLRPMLQPKFCSSCRKAPALFEHLLKRCHQCPLRAFAKGLCNTMTQTDGTQTRRNESMSALK